MDYTICSKVLEAVKTDKSYIGSLLYKFCDENNPIKVIKNDKIIDCYNAVALDDNDDIAQWIRCMGYNSDKCWRERECADEPIFIKTSKSTNDRKLIVSEKEDYSSEEYDGITPIDKDEAVKALRPPTTSIVVENSTLNECNIRVDNS